MQQIYQGDNTVGYGKKVFIFFAWTILCVLAGTLVPVLSDSEEKNYAVKYLETNEE